MKDQNLVNVYDAIASLANRQEVERFMLDLTTPAERKAFEERWAIAQLLEAGELSYRDISSKTGASTTTVSRVNRFLKQEPHRGYRIVLDRAKKV